MMQQQHHQILHYDVDLINADWLSNLLRDQRNFIEAAFVGASSAIPLVLNISANLVAFLSLLAALDGFLSWFGGLLDFPELSFTVRFLSINVFHSFGIWTKRKNSIHPVSLYFFSSFAHTSSSHWPIWWEWVGTM